MTRTPDDVSMVFPAEFVFGSATAAYQVEGAAKADGRGPSIWDRFAALPGATRNGDTGARACEHYHRYEADLDLAQEIGLSAYRFSISWSRIFPDGRTLNMKGLDHYRKVAEACKKRDLNPYITLYHWDLPQALEEAGGWPLRDTAFRFADYAEHVHSALGDLVTQWITVNEPAVCALAGYAYGDHAPGRREPHAALRAGHHLLLGHGLAAGGLRADPTAHIGISLNHWPATPATDRPEDVSAARRSDGHANRMYFDPVLLGRYPEDMLNAYGAENFGHIAESDLSIISTPLDFLGISYHSTNVFAARKPSETREEWPYLGVREVPRAGAKDAMGWHPDPDGLQTLLESLPSQYPACPPLLITENGTASDDYLNPEGDVVDEERRAYLESHLLAVHSAMRAGSDVRGYFAWSLLDNFEWAHGYSKRFGLIFVEFATQRRILKRSALWLRDRLNVGTWRISTQVIER